MTLAVLEQNINLAGWAHEMVRFRSCWRPSMCSCVKEERGRLKFTAHAVCLVYQQR
jgi:hypothetical protein